MKKSKKRKDGNNTMTIKALAGIIAFVTGFSWCAATESTYKRNAVVDQIDKGFVSAYDESGNDWEFWGDGFYIGQEITLVMDDNHTPTNIYDDIVKNVLTK